MCDPNPPELNTWEHYVVIYDDGAEMAYVYRDAELVASGAFSDSMKGFNAIGTSTGSPSLLKARYDEVSYYHRALDEAEITEHYEAVAGETEEATVIWSVFGSGSPGRRTARVVP